MENEKRYYVKISGAAWDIRASSKEEAIKEVRRIAEVYCSFYAQEIGVDCDQYGYTIRRDASGNVLV